MKMFWRFAVIASCLCVAGSIARAQTYTAYLTPAQEVPAAISGGSGRAVVNINPTALTISFTVIFNNMTSAQTLSHIHAPAPVGGNAAVIINFGTVGGTSGTITGSGSITQTQINQIRAGQGYVNVHSTNFPNGELRGQLAQPRPIDYDGDGRNDYSVWRFPNVAPPGVASITYYNLNSTAGFQAAGFGDANRDFPAPGDYDGDGKGDLAVMRNGSVANDPNFFYIIRSSNNTFQAIQWGLSGDEAVARDYDGDGKTDPAVFRRGAAAGNPAFWYILQSATGTFRGVQWGTTGDGTNNADFPVAADYDGDGKADLCVYRFGLSPANTYILLRSSDNAVVFQPFGNFNTDYVAPADYDGDGKADFTAIRTGAMTTSPLTWYILRSSTGTVSGTTFGLTTDLVAQGDYDGDGKGDIAIYRSGATASASSTFYVLRSFDNTVTGTSFGLGSDFAVNTFDQR